VLNYFNPVPDNRGECSGVVHFRVGAVDDRPGVSFSSLAVSPDGSTTVICTNGCTDRQFGQVITDAAVPVGSTIISTATDSAGQTATCSFVLTDMTRPTIFCPNLTVPCGVDRLVPVTYPAPTVSDNCDPSPVVTYSIPSGSGFPIGTTTVRANATDSSGNLSVAAWFTVTRAALGFTGFLAPVGGADATGGSFSSPVRGFKVGSTIPIKFTASCEGTPVTTGVHTFQAIQWSTETNPDTPMDVASTEAATTGNQFQLSDEGEWHFNLRPKEAGMSIGKWQLIATLSDGSQHSAWIQLE